MQKKKLNISKQLLNLEKESETLHKLQKKKAIAEFRLYTDHDCHEQHLSRLRICIIFKDLDSTMNSKHL